MHYYLGYRDLAPFQFPQVRDSTISNTEYARAERAEECSDRDGFAKPSIDSNRAWTTVTIHLAGQRILVVSRI